MRFPCIASFLLLAVGASATDGSKDDSVYHPIQVKYQALLGAQRSNADSKVLLEALGNIGMISVTDMPESFRQAKAQVQSLLPSCMESMETTTSHTFEDGTKRTTLATHTLQGDMAPLMIPSEATACMDFEAASKTFRAEVDRVTHAFAHRLSNLCDDGKRAGPLLQSVDDQDFGSLAEVVQHGEHLEHFHNYQKQNEEVDSTIEWHTDQGLFLVFTPGMLVNQRSGTDAEVADGFYIELPGGARPMVHFDDNDDLVILLGDGIRQIRADKCNGDESLRALPHAFSMPASSTQISRVWYGRMVLAPASAVHPEHQKDGMTFGDLRARMIRHGDSDQSIMTLGCSGSSSIARQLEESSCEEGTLLCWHRCMSVQEQNITETLCQEQGLDLRCVNPRGQLWDNTHGDWFPSCVDGETAPEASPLPSLPDYPRDEGNCTEAAYEAFVQGNAAQYDHMMNLTNGGVLYWTVQDDDTINGMLSYNGLFGYLALGFAGPMSPGARNEMVGAKIIMATASSEYNASHGFDFDFAPTVQEYSIGTEFAFRHWQTPLSAVSRQNAIVSDTSTYQVQEDDECFTSMTFATAGIFDKPFNVSGMDAMIWAANGEDMFAGYHGDSRGVVYVEWNQGVATLKQEETDEENGDGTDGDEGGDEGSDDPSSAVSITGAASMALAVVGVSVALVF